MKQHAKTAIINSFKELLSEKSIDKITIKEICKQCNVNRQTFYYYFTDIRDIFKFVIFDELSVEIAQNRTFETWEGGFLATMNYLRKNSRMILHVYHSSYWLEASAYFVNFSNKLLDDVVTECAERQCARLCDEDQTFIVSFYRHVFNGLIIDWINGGMKSDPKIILRRLLIMITGSISRSVSAFAKAAIEK